MWVGTSTTQRILTWLNSKENCKLFIAPQYSLSNLKHGLTQKRIVRVKSVMAALRGEQPPELNSKENCKVPLSRAGYSYRSGRWLNSKENCKATELQRRRQGIGYRLNSKENCKCDAQCCFHHSTSSCLTQKRIVSFFVFFLSSSKSCSLTQKRIVR